MVVQGTAVQFLWVRRVLPEGIDLSQMPPEKAAAVGFLVTDVKVRLDKILWINPAVPALSRPPDEIVVSQLGGGDETNIYVIHGQPPLKIGQEYVLFLFREPPDKSYTLVAGPSGYFIVKEGKLLAVREEGHDLSTIARRYDGAEVTALQAALARLN